MKKSHASAGCVLASAMPGGDSIGVAVGIGIGIEGIAMSFDIGTVRRRESIPMPIPIATPRENQPGGETPNEALHETGPTESGRASRVTGAAWAFFTCSERIGARGAGLPCAA